MTAIGVDFVDGATMVIVCLKTLKTYMFSVVDTFSILKTEAEGSSLPLFLLL